MRRTINCLARARLNCRCSTRGVVVSGLAGAGLPVGTYRLTVVSNLNSSIHDLAGNPLLGPSESLRRGRLLNMVTEDARRKAERVLARLKRTIV